MSNVTLFHGDCRDVMRRLIDEGRKVHSVVCDPPYGLVSITKRFGNGQAPARTDNNDGSFARVSAGFMNQKWDGTGIENDPSMWRLVYELLLPGGYLLAFSSPRTGHRMACAIEDAGFIIHPFIGWANGQGFPKAHAADKAIDRELGTPGRINAAGKTVRRIRPGADQNKDGTWEKLDDREYQPGTYIPGSPEAEKWRGYAYGGQVRKPLLEPVYVAQKPFSERNGALNILKHGVGAVNIDGCRIPVDGEEIHVPQGDPSKRSGVVGSDLGISGVSIETFQAAQRASVERAMSLGRHPANLILTPSPREYELRSDVTPKQLEELRQWLADKN